MLTPPALQPSMYRITTSMTSITPGLTSLMMHPPAGHQRPLTNTLIASATTSPPMPTPTSWHTLIFTCTPFAPSTKTTQPFAPPIRCCLFHCIDLVLCPNYAANHTRQDPNSLKNYAMMGKKWTTKKAMLVWLVDSINHIISLPASRLSKFNMFLNLFLPSQHDTSKRHWYSLLGTLWSLFIDIIGGSGLFSTSKLHCTALHCTALHIQRNFDPCRP